MAHGESHLGAAVITGASSGIGREVAKLLAKRNHTTILIARRADRLNALAQTLSADAPSYTWPMDLTDSQRIEPTMQAIEQKHGPVNVLVNAAGQGLLKPFLEQTHDDLMRQMQLHYVAAAQMIHSVLPGMLQRRQGHVINIASIAAKVGPWGHSTYAAAKSALATLTHTLTAEYGGAGVHFSCVFPGVILTEFFDQPTYAGLAEQIKKHGVSAEKAAEQIVRLLDRPRLELIIPRHYRVIDWLKCIAPSLMHGKIARQGRPSDLSS